jgi:aminopeptidase N
MHKLSRVSVLAGALLATAAAAASADTYPRQTGITITHYTFDVTLNDANNDFVVHETVSVRFLKAGVSSVDLDLCKFSQPPRAANTPEGIHDPCAEPSGGGRRGGPAATPTGGKGMTVTAIASGGRAIAFTHDHDRVHVTLPHAFKAGDQFEFTIDYHGVPATGILAANNKYGDREFFSNPWPNNVHNYLAVIDHPYSKVPVTTSITAPRKYQVIANGRLVEQLDLPNDLRKTTWSEAVPICTWQISAGVAPFAVAHFGEYHGIPLSAWVYPQEKDVSLPAFGAFTQPILEFYIDHIGPFSYEKLAQVEANGVGGGMELASDIFYGYNATTGPGRQLMAHEMAHQWFGDSATEADWDHVWLSEGFATYFALLYQEFQDGHDAFLEGVKRSKAQAINYALNNPASTIVHENLADHSKVIANNAQIYQGGAQVLQNVRGVVGTENFWAGIRNYYRKFQNSNATSDDFRHAMEGACAAAGDKCPADGKDLSWLFTELLTRGGALQVKGTWHYDAAGKQVVVTLDQTQTSGLYRMPIEVWIAKNVQAGPTIQVAHLTDQHQVFTFPSDTEPASVLLDPNAWVMMQASFSKQE